MKDYIITLDDKEVVYYTFLVLTVRLKISWCHHIGICKQFYFVIG